MVDPANPCFRCSAYRIRAVMRPRLTAEWVSNLVEKFRRPAGGKKSAGRKKRPTKLNRGGKQLPVLTARQSAAEPAPDATPAKNPAIRAELHGLCAAARRRLPLFRGPEVLSCTASFIARLPRLSERAARLTQLVHELGRDFPSDKVEEALKRLIERRYIVPATVSSVAPLQAIGRALACRRESRNKISEIAVCASNRSTCRAQPNSAAP